MIKVYYDGKCGVCRNEMAHYRRIAPAGVFEWLDIVHMPLPKMPLGLSRVEALKVLHVQDDHGKLHRGLDAFLVIWQQLPRFHYLYRSLRLPGIHCLAQGAYRIFAGVRFRWMGYGRLLKSCRPCDPRVERRTG